MTQTQILIVEDEVKLANVLSDYLVQANYSVTCLHEGTGVVDWVKHHSPQAIVLDLMLPGKDGMEICKELRTFTNVPILMVTARVDEIDRLLGLEIGADDYICKPFSPREVVARVRAVLRRSQNRFEPQGKQLVLDESRCHAEYDGQMIELTAIEFKLLDKLYKEPGHIFSREQLMNNIYSDHRVVSGRTIDSHIKKLRKKLAIIETEEELIKSVYGLGYKWEG
jgi:two-component system response regulator BaeR